MKRVYCSLFLILSVVGCNFSGRKDRDGSEEPSISLGADTVGLGPLVTLQQAKQYADSSKDSASERLYEYAKLSVILGAQATLGRMGFWPGSYSGVLDRGTVSALREYEAARHLPVTGNLFASATYRRLSADESRLERIERRPSLGITQFTWEQDLVGVEGPWVTDGDSSESYEAIDILCSRRQGQCTVASARLAPFLSANTLQLRPSTSTYQVERWDAAEIVTQPIQYACAREVLRINRAEKTAVIVSSTTSDTGPMCHVMHGLPETVSHLADNGVLDSLDAAEGTSVLDSLIQLGSHARAILNRLREAPKPPLHSQNQDTAK